MKDFMLHIRNCINNDDCNYLISFFDNNEQLAVQGSVGNIEKLDDLEIPISIFSSPFLKKNILEAFDKYKTIFPLLQTNHNNWEVDDIAYLMRYEPKAHYSYIHCESDGSPNRILAWMLYLNTIKIGGGTEFIHQNTKKKDEVIIPPCPSKREQRVGDFRNDKRIERVVGHKRGQDGIECITIYEDVPFTSQYIPEIPSLVSTAVIGLVAASSPLLLNAIKPIVKQIVKKLTKKKDKVK